ncbi:XdhC family protein [Wenjunlia tyrosinilytica]|uniref:Xanthine dehydrogenase n=1 Tax=Wenjunlia tyrosinilytica TaxID=1544741 RepID=A0A917ZSC9_9ACTN|nr:XdhC/CoxI family protein [Wenjunlia tyrosinilytica]GGO92405.1 xanthine dehydrogenase [Wenjunlia tyrosinilytica]
MLDIAEELHRWCEQGRAFAVATVVAVSGSGPRQPGAALAVDDAGTAIGSVSGGCVEAAVYELCQEALESGRSVLQRFGYSDEDAFAVGLTCGGVIDIFVQPVRPRSAGRPLIASAVDAASRGQAAAVARIVEGPDELLGRALMVRSGGPAAGTSALDTSAPGTSASGVSASGASASGSLGDDGLDRSVAGEAAALLDAGRTELIRIGADGSRCGEPLSVLVESSVPPPRMLVFGAIDFASAVVRVGKFLGYRVTVCDARPVFATPARFPDADEVVVDWPHRYLDGTAVDGRTVMCVLTHDAKFDIPLLQRALRLPVAYVGAMGSRRTHEDRLGRLREAGVTEFELARLHSPIGLDLGARTPEETALSIGAEIVAHRRGGSGAPLTRGTGPIHHEGRSPTRRVGSVA